jgi:nucleoside-triphosphatase
MELTNLLITGYPRFGKTTLIKKILQNRFKDQNAGGFITEEFRKKGERIGFHILTIPEGKKGLLAQKGISSPHHVGRYGVNIHLLEELGCPAILQAKTSKTLVIVDEIGKMELFSEKFRTILIDALNSPQKVLATIMERSNSFADMIKKRPDTRLINLARENFEEVYHEVLNWLDK